MKAPRRGSQEERALKQGPIIPRESQLPLVNVDPFGDDYLSNLNDINEIFTEDPIVKGGLDDTDNTLTIQEVDLGVRKDWKTRTNRRGSGPDSIALKNEYEDAVVMDTSLNNAIERLKNADSRVGTDIAEESKKEAAKIAKAHELDPVLRERDMRLKIAESISLTALNTELLNQLRQNTSELLFELKDFKRIKTKEEHIEGKEVTLIHSMTTADGVVRIDFTDLASFIGPADMKRDIQGQFPSKKVFSLSIQVVSGGPLWYAVNEADYMRTYAKITVGIRALEASKPTFESLNFRVDANTDVAIIATY
jgi:hypothetical protein